MYDALCHFYKQKIRAFKMSSFHEFHVQHEKNINIAGGALFFIGLGSLLFSFWGSSAPEESQKEDSQLMPTTSQMPVPTSLQPFIPAMLFISTSDFSENVLSEYMGRLKNATNQREVVKIELAFLTDNLKGFLNELHKDFRHIDAMFLQNATLTHQEIVDYFEHLKQEAVSLYESYNYFAKTFKLWNQSGGEFSLICQQRQDCVLQNVALNTTYSCKYTHTYKPNPVCNKSLVEVTTPLLAQLEIPAVNSTLDVSDPADRDAAILQNDILTLFIYQFKKVFDEYTMFLSDTSPLFECTTVVHCFPETWHFCLLIDTNNVHVCKEVEMCSTELV
jgi:hypothetical protein